MIAFEQAGRIDQVGAPHGIENIGDGHVGLEQLRGVRADLEFRLFPALHEDGGNAIQPVQARLDVIGRQLPKIGLRCRVRGQAVADDGKAGEGQAMRFDVHRGRQASSARRPRRS